MRTRTRVAGLFGVLLGAVVPMAAPAAAQEEFVHPIEVRSPTSMQEIPVGAVVLADYSCQGDGLLTCEGGQWNALENQPGQCGERPPHECVESYQPIADGAPLDTSVPGIYEFTVTSHYGDGGYALTNQQFFVQSDQLDPTITIVTPADGATYEAGEVVLADWSCADTGGAGLLYCNGHPVGSPIDTSPGTHRFEVDALDYHGNYTKVVHTYRVPDETSAVVPPGGTLSTGAGEEPTAADPVEASVQLPAGTGGTVTIVERDLGTVPDPPGYELVGKAVDITAPPGTAGDPLILTFRIEQSVLVDAGLTAHTVAVLRNGVPLPPCSAGTLPCVASRSTDPYTEDATLVIRTIAASTWTFAAPTASYSVSDVKVAEGNAGATKTAKFTVTRTGDRSTAGSVHLHTESGTSAPRAIQDKDFKKRDTIVQFPAGVAAVQVNVTIIGDNLDEPHERFRVVLDNPVNGIVTDHLALGTITDDD